MSDTPENADALRQYLDGTKPDPSDLRHVEDAVRLLPAEQAAHLHNPRFGTHDQ